MAAVLLAQQYGLAKQARALVQCAQACAIGQKGAAAPGTQQAQLKHLAVTASDFKILLPNENKTGLILCTRAKGRCLIGDNQGGVGVRGVGRDLEGNVRVRNVGLE